LTRQAETTIRRPKTRQRSKSVEDISFVKATIVAINKRGPNNKKSSTQRSRSSSADVPALQKTTIYVLLTSAAKTAGQSASVETFRLDSPIAKARKQRAINRLANTTQQSKMR
jgi:hypothetical protein